VADDTDLLIAELLHKFMNVFRHGLLVISTLRARRLGSNRATTFTTMDDMVRAQIRISLGRLLRHQFDNVTSLKAILSQNQVPEI
jgi:hypothetical protein